MRYQNKNKGFTLVETLVAITVLVSVVAAPIFIASQGIKTMAFARDQVIAAYLAQDAVEFVIAKKKQNTLNEVLQISNGLLLNLDVCTSPAGGCFIDTTILSCPYKGTPVLLTVLHSNLTAQREHTVMTMARSGWRVVLPEKLRLIVYQTARPYLL